ncbi:hypothetical protein MMC30_003668 [Trapelia coarctata]|nr:hypothetical protein [Trapelia coarctata]
MIESGLEIVANERIPVQPSMYAQISELHILALEGVPRGLSEVVDRFRNEDMHAFIEERRRGVATVDEIAVLWVGSGEVGSEDVLHSFQNEDMNTVDR